MLYEIENLYNEITRSGRRIDEIYSINDTILQLLKNYLHNREYLVEILNNINEESKNYIIYEIKNIKTDIKFNQTFTITFGDQAENHVGMMKLGQPALHGLTLIDLKKVEIWFKEKNIKTEFIHLNSLINNNGDDAYLLIIRSGISTIVNTDEMYSEQEKLEKDTKAYMYGRVVNKKARHNLCFGNISQEPNYEQKAGRIIAFKDVPLLNTLRNALPEIVGDKAINLMAEGNYYYNLKECGIGFHGDSERKIVIGVRLGSSFPLHFQWWFKREQIGERLKIVLNHGDIYLMSSKTVGTDWKRHSIYTLRHAAGCAKYTSIR